MGNVCCTDRRLNKPSEINTKVGKTITKSQKVSVSKSPTRIKKQETSNFDTKTTQFQNSIYLDTDKSIKELDVNDSLIKELEYDMIEAEDLSEFDQNCIIKIFSSYALETPLGEEELYEGLTKVTVHESETYNAEKTLLISNFAIYVLKSEDITYVYRRIRLENIQVIVVNNNLNSAVFNVVRNEISGDL